MEQVYALGVNVIEFIQYWCKDWSYYLEQVNDLSNPHFLMEVLLPLVSVVDSVFAAQLLLCLGFGGWLNAVMKWWMLEDRPYWWVQSTSFYRKSRPKLLQTRQSCESGPGSPSGHSAAAAAVLILVLMWVAHAASDRKWRVRWWRRILYPMCAAAMCSVMLARLYVAAHFPHQCLLGALIGAFLAPALCIYVSDPFIWRYGGHENMDVRTTVAWHVACVLIMAAISVVTWFSLKLCGIDPQWTVKMAFRYCNAPENIHVSTTPLFSLSQSVAYLLGWALCVTPSVARYRHYTKERSLIISTFATGLIVYGVHHISSSIDKTNAVRNYACHALIAALKPALLLRVAPFLAAWPYERAKVISGMHFFEKSTVGQVNNFSHDDLLQCVESLLKESSSQQPSEGHYSWLKSRHVHHDFSKDLESFKPLVMKMTSESCASVAVKLDNITRGNVTASVILGNFRRLLLEEQSTILINDNVRRARERSVRRNKVRPELPAGRQPVVSFVLE